MKSKKGNIPLTIFAVLSIIVLLAGVGFVVYKVGTQSAVPSEGISAGGVTASGIQLSGGCNQNPSPSISYVNALTKQSITASNLNVKDVKTGQLLGASPNLQPEQEVQPIVNASGYITEVRDKYEVPCGNYQQIGELYQFANATIKLYDDVGTGQIGGTTAVIGQTGNDSVITVSANHKITITEASYRSTGRMLLVFEASNSTSLSSVALSSGGVTIPSITVPNCYSNVLTSPYRTAWEIQAVKDGNQVIYNLQVASLNSLAVSGQALLTVYYEKDAVDTGSNAFLTSGICDSLNTAFNNDKRVFTWYYNEA